MFRRKSSERGVPEESFVAEEEPMESVINALAKNGRYISEIVEGPPGVGPVFFFQERVPLEAPEIESIPDEN
ncbi:hypothetical protein BH09PAT4_BH09PAT4_05830 [soil metagenome]